MITKEDFKKINDYLWEISKDFRSDMKVPARIYVDEKMLEQTFKDRSVEQLVNTATLPGVINYSMAMPDIHEGYGFPIGGVAGMRVSDGVISPGGVGYDINCTSGDTNVLLEHGCYSPIRQLENNWKDINLQHAIFRKKSLAISSPVYFLKKICNPHIIQITTIAGNQIKVTGDHPIYTSDGMKETKRLTKGDKIAILPFKGVRYKKPSNKIILSEESFKKVLTKLKDNSGNAFKQILSHLKRLNVFPLKYDSPELPYLLKIMGYVLGDGYISFIGKGKVGTVGFNGKKEDLIDIRNDIQRVGFTPSRIYSRGRNHRIKTHYKEYKFSTTENSFRVSSSGFATFLVALGLPYGLRTEKEYRIPKWIFNCPLWQKRLFLASFFGAELSTPSTLNKYNFYAPQLNMQKSKRLEKNAKLFLKDIKKLLDEFEIKTHTIQEVPGYEYKGKRGNTVGFRLQISEKADNLVRFFETISYEYNREKFKKSCLAVNYLKKKLKIVDLRAEARKEIKKLYKKKGDFKKLAEKYSSKYTPVQFLYHSLFKEESWGVRKKRGNPRIAFNFPSFEEYKRKYAYGNKGLVWDEIERIEKIPYKDFVYDFTINHSDHNFIANNFVVSNCGMKLLRSEYLEKDIKPHLDKLATRIQEEVPSGLGRGRQIKLSIDALDKILKGGAKRLVEEGYGEKEDMENCESNGCIEQADSSAVSSHAKNRGRDQVGTLGSGNHFMEIQKVEQIFDEETAKKFGLFKNQVVVMIHTGSRGLGHQIATDYIQVMMKAMPKYKIKLPDRELACVPFNSPEGQRYFKAMSAGANFAWANRQMIAHYIRKVWKEVLGEKASKLIAIYDVAHNIAKIEKHSLDGKELELIVHRKGATRAFPGQPVLIPGSMGTASYVLVGVEQGKDSWYSTCHGAGRTMSRHAAIRALSGQEVVNQLKAKGILIKCYSMRGIAEEAPQAYKNIDEVVEVVHQAGLSKKVARLIPLAVIKGE
jgi:tRNA-splicing ligase RtcB